MASNIVIPGMNEFIASVNNATVKITDNLNANMRKACLIVEGEAKRKCPVDTGVLKASMHSEVEQLGNVITGKVSNNCKYAAYVHNGTGIYAKNGGGRSTPWTYVVDRGKYKGGHTTQGQKPQPFLENARNAKLNDIIRILNS